MRKTGIIKHIILFNILITFIIQASYSQSEIFNGRENKTGINIGYGVKNLREPDESEISYSEYIYKVFFIQLQWYEALLKKASWGVDLLLQPQFNISRYNPQSISVDLTNGYEFGLNAGLVIRKNYADDFLSIYFITSVGPHYISGAPDRQVPGFIFSDNLNAGLNLRIRENLYMDIRTGVRHISNARLKMPNDGVNSMIISTGLFIVY